MNEQSLKKFPVFRTDEEAEEFVANADLSEYDFSNFKPMHFEFVSRREKISLELPEKLLDAVKTKATENNISYTQFIEQVLEKAVS